MTDCPNCGFDAGESKFCPNCGTKIGQEKPKSFCHNCGAEINGSKFCPNCGSEIDGEKIKKDCPNCGKSLNIDAEFCPYCGWSESKNDSDEVRLTSNELFTTLNKKSLTSEEIEYVVNQYIDVIDRLKVDNRDEIVKDYIRMCFLDVLTGNKDRVSGNYGLIKSGNDYSFAPSFDSSTIGYPGIDDNYVQLNHYLIDRKDLYNYLISNYYECLSDIFDKDRKHIVDKMKSLLDVVFSREEDKSDKEWFDRMVIGQLDYYLNSVNSLFAEDEISEAQAERMVEEDSTKSIS